MAKDGTSRGGARPGAGRKKKALSEKIAAGNPGHRPLKMLDPVAIDKLLSVEKPNKHIWECACGGGAFSSAFKRQRV